MMILYYMNSYMAKFPLTCIYIVCIIYQNAFIYLNPHSYANHSGKEMNKSKRKIKI